MLKSSAVFFNVFCIGKTADIFWQVNLKARDCSEALRKCSNSENMHNIFHRYYLFSYLASKKTYFDHIRANEIKFIAPASHVTINIKISLILPASQIICLLRHNDIRIEKSVIER